jgi:ribosomal protein S13
VIGRIWGCIDCRRARRALIEGIGEAIERVVVELWGFDAQKKVADLRDAPGQLRSDASLG